MPQCVGLSCRFSGRATIRGELALKRKHIIAAKAKKNQQLSEGRGVKGCQNSDNLIERVDTKKELAKIAGVSHDTIARVHGSGRCQAIPTHRLCAPPVLTHDHPGDTGREKMPSVENAVGRVQGSGPPHYSGIRFGIRFRGADPITSDQSDQVLAGRRGARVTYQSYGSGIGDMAICRHRARMRDRRLSYHETRSPGGAGVG